MDTKWLQKRLDSRQGSIASLARAVGRDRAAMSRIVNDGQALPLWMVPILARELGVSELEVLSRTGELKIPTLASAPLIPWPAAGAFAMTETPVDISADYERCYVQSESESLITLRVDTREMDRIAPPGSTIVVDYSQKALPHMALGVFTLADRPVFRRLHQRGRKVELHCESSEARFNAKVDTPVGVVGRVISIPCVASLKHEPVA